MRKLKTGLLALMLAAGAFWLSGCSQVDESLLENNTDFSISINVPYPTSTPKPQSGEALAQVVIDSNGGVKLNDSSLLNGSYNSALADESQYETLALGDTSPAVQSLQQRLAALGYFTEGVSGVFDEATKSAVKRFEQSFGIMQTGIATPAFQVKLYAEDAPVYGSAEYDEAVVSQYSTLQRGAVGSSVYALQHRLKELGYPVKELSGVYDENTEKAVKLFAEAYGVDNMTVAYIALQKELYSDNALTYSAGNARVNQGGAVALTVGNSGTKVMQIQNQLIKLGYMTGNASGVYDVETQAAVRLFESACGVNPTGQLNNELLNILLSANAPIYGTRYDIPVRTYSDLQQGSQGDQVSQLQERLIELGYASGSANGVYGSETTAAVKLFQRYNGLEETGYATSFVQECMFSLGALSYQDILSGLTYVTPTPVPTQNVQTLANDIAAETGERVLGLGSTGDAVKKLQKRLNKLGYECSTDGNYDESTSDAMKAFQANVGVSQTGIVSKSMLDYIYTNAAPAKVYQMHNSTQHYTVLKLGDESEDVTRLQQQLWQLGYLLTDDVEDSIGIFHEETEAAVKSAQRAMGYSNPDGVATAEFQCFVFSEYNYFIKK